jgi:putative FmdB family regulatory protein
MPVYEYECLECGKRFDKLQRFNASSPPKCPLGHSRVHRLLSQPTIIFKGSGFYITDNGRNGRGTSSHSVGTKSRTGADQADSAATTGENDKTSSKATT